jgi:O-antigen/teichoic acid export membrane protein
MFTTITDMGLTPVLIRESAKDHANAEKYLNQTLSLKLPLTCMAVLAAIIGAWLFHIEPVTRTLVTLAAIVISLDAISLTFYGILRGHHVLKYEGFGLVIGQSITMVIGVIALKMHAPLWVLVVALIAGSAWNALSSWWVVTHKLKIRVRPTWDRAFAISLLRIAFPFALAGLFVKVYTSADAVLLTHFHGETAAGLYSVPYKLTFAFQFVPMAFTAAFYPAMSRAFASDKQALGDLLYRALWSLMLIVAPIVAGIAVLAPDLVLFVYGKEYLPSVIAVETLILALVPIFLDFPIGSLLNASDRQMTQTKLMGLATIVSLALNLALIPEYGLVGVVIASIVSHVVLIVGGFIAIGRFLTWPKAKFIGAAVRTTAAAGVMAGVVVLAKPYLPLPLSVLLGALAYPAAAFALGAVSLADLRALVSDVSKRSV